jgi:SAM-dependent methyltransferase
VKETHKSRPHRERRGDFEKYLHGSGIDIGGGDDVLVVLNGTVRRWDLEDGDAQLMSGVPDETYDFVYSSHCLEHMRDTEESLRNWVRICKTGGFLYVVVPDYVLYEKLTWPSRFNPDHKQSFSFLVTRQAVARPNHFHVDADLLPLFKRLGIELLAFHVEDNRFNYNFGLADQTQMGALAQLCFIGRKAAAPAAT